MIFVHLAILITIAHHIEVSSEYECGARPSKETLSMMMMMKIKVMVMNMMAIKKDDDDEDQSDDDQSYKYIDGDG